jgi:hypothetical protein
MSQFSANAYHSSDPLLDRRNWRKTKFDVLMHLSWLQKVDFVQEGNRWDWERAGREEVEDVTAQLIGYVDTI